MEERKRDDDEEKGVDVEEPLVESDVDEGDDNEGTAAHGEAGASNRATLWLILATTSTLVGRRLLTTDFPYPICFVLLLQLTAYLFVVAAILFVRLKDIRSPKRKCSSDREYTWFEDFIIASRFIASFFVSTTAMICGAEALLRFTNLPVLALLPIFSYVIDSLLGRVSRLDQHPTREGGYRTLFALTCVVIAVYEDYRLDPIGLWFAVVTLILISISKLIPRMGPRIENGSVHTWDCPLYVYLLIGIPPMIITIIAACRFEDVSSAFSVAWSWSFWRLLSYLAPGAALLVVFNNSMSMVYPFSTESAFSALEEDNPQARMAVATTLQASFWISCIGVFLGETNLVDWIQVLAFTLLYVVGTGPRHIGFYPPRLMNLIARVLRKPQQKVIAEPWQLPFFLWITISIFVALISSSLLYWNVHVAYSRGLKVWTGLKSPSLDSGYVPPQPHLFEIVIAHSELDPLESITDLVSTFATLELIEPNMPRVKIYTKDMSLNTTDFAKFSGPFTGPLSSAVLHNTGGVAATFLHHILYSWDFLPSQTLFLSTSSPYELSTIKARFNNYFVPTLPIHSTRSAEPVTSFLNLGDYSTCQCSSCSDSLGWHDTFRLIPSMSGAANPGSPPCKTVLLTHGNNFVVSADRIRGLGRDVWQMLYDALVNVDLGNAWAHDEEKLPARKGKWEGVFGEEDSLEKPYLGYTIERLWGILLQCSIPEVAWRCPNTIRGWRSGGVNGDCGCLHW